MSEKTVGEWWWWHSAVAAAVQGICKLLDKLKGGGGERRGGRGEGRHH